MDTNSHPFLPSFENIFHPCTISVSASAPAHRAVSLHGAHHRLPIWANLLKMCLNKVSCSSRCSVSQPFCLSHDAIDHVSRRPPMTPTEAATAASDTNGAIQLEINTIRVERTWLLRRASTCSHDGDNGYLILGGWSFELRRQWATTAAGNGITRSMLFRPSWVVCSDHKSAAEDADIVTPPRRMRRSAPIGRSDATDGCTRADWPAIKASLPSNNVGGRAAVDSGGGHGAPGV